ncbi:MAG: hypothetical protein ACOC3V_05660, partial [bacterium]
TDTNVNTALETIDLHGHNLDNLLNVDTTGKSDNNILTWDSSTSKWIVSTMPDSGASELNELTDVSIISPSNGHILKYNLSENRWENSQILFYLDDILDVTISSGFLADGHILRYDGDTSQWINETINASKITSFTTNFDNILSTEDNIQDALDTLDDHSHTVEDLTNTEITTIEDGQVLVWDTVTSKWINQDLSSGVDNLNDLTDTNLTTPSEGDILKYNSSSEWENQKDTKTVGITLGSKGVDLDLISSYPIYAPFSGTIKRVIGVVNTAPTGADLIIDININGTSIWNSTQGNRLTITDGNTSGTQTSFDTTSVTEGDVITIDIDQIGSTTAGQDLTVQIEINKL